VQNLSIVEALESSEFFADSFPNIETWTAWKIFLKSVYGIELNKNELEVFQECTQRESVLPNGFSEVYCICGRRGGKSKIASLIAAYEAILGGWEQKLSPGERGWIFVVSTDKSQSGIVLNYIRELLSHVPDIIERELSDELHLTNHISIGIKTCSYRGVRGFSTVGIIADEVAFWRDENSANPAEEIVISLLPGLKEGGRLVGISTPYARYGFLYEQFKNFYGRSDSDTLIWRAGTKFMNPTYPDAIINRLVKRDKVAFDSEYNAEFRSDVANFLSEEIIRAAMKHAPLPYDQTKSYYAFIDPSGGRSDSMTLAISHREEEKIVIDRVEETRAPFDPSSVVQQFSTLLKSYHVYEATSDRYAGVWPESAFSKEGVVLRMSELPASDLYLEFQPLMAMGRVELPNDERLCLQFQMLERRTRTGGRDSVDHPPGLHDDMANSAAGAAYLAAQKAWWDEATRESMMPVHRWKKV
jgi:hypothetical protein